MYLECGTTFNAHKDIGNELCPKSTEKLVLLYSMDNEENGTKGD